MEDNGRVEQERTSTAKDHQNVLGRCRLNDKDKMTQPDAFKATPYDDEYIENHCHHRQTEDETCSYELYANSTFIYGEIKVIGLNQKEVINKFQISFINLINFYVNFVYILYFFT